LPYFIHFTADWIIFGKGEFHDTVSFVTIGAVKTKLKSRE